MRASAHAPPSACSLNGPASGPLPGARPPQELSPAPLSPRGSPADPVLAFAGQGPLDFLDPWALRPAIRHRGTARAPPPDAI